MVDQLKAGQKNIYVISMRIFSVCFLFIWGAWVYFTFHPKLVSLVFQYSGCSLVIFFTKIIDALCSLIGGSINGSSSPFRWNELFLVKEVFFFHQKYRPYFHGKVVFAATWISILSAVITGIFLYLWNGNLRFSWGRKKEIIVRGAKEISQRELIRQTRISKFKRPTEEEINNQLLIGNVPIPRDVENIHFLFVGSTGTGKSQGMYQIAEKIQQRCERAFILDLGGGMLSRFATDNDFLLNPLDIRTSNWNPFLDIQNEGDLEALVQASIPSVQGDSEEWRGFTRTLMLSVMSKLIENDEAKPSRVVYFATEAGPKELAQLCHGTPAQRFFEKGNEKLLANSLPSFAQAVKPWRDLIDGGDFSIREWVKNEKSSLYITPQDKQMEALSPLITTWIWIAISEALTLPPDENRRLWFFLDELGSYGQLPKFSDALTKLRKYGGCVVAALQDVAQLDANYGREQARAIRNCFSTVVAYRCEDPETARYIAERVGGDQEVQHERRSYTSGGNTRTETHSTEYRQRASILPSQIGQLPKFAAYLKIGGGYHAAKVAIPLCQVPAKRKPFEPRLKKKRA